MHVIDPVSFFSEIARRKFDQHSLCQTLNRYLGGGTRWPLLVRLHGETVPSLYQLRFCGPDFLVLERENEPTKIVPVTSVMTIEPKAPEPFSLFRSLERPEPVNLLTDGLRPQATAWSTTGSAKCDPIPGTGQFAYPVRFDSSADWNRRGLVTPLLHTRLHEVSVVFRATCARLCVYIWGQAESVARGPIGGVLGVQNSPTGPVSQIGWDDLPDGFRRLTLHWTPAQAVAHRIGVGDDGSAGSLDLYAIGLAQIG